MTYDFTLHRGAGRTAEKACLMQRAALIHAERNGYLDRLPVDKVLTDHPCWANKSLTVIGIRCNDTADDEERQRLRPMLERILRAERRTPEVERRIDVRILCAQALDDHAKAIAEEGAVLGDGEAGRLVAEFVQAAGS